MNDNPRILIILLGSLGDVIRGLSIVKPLRNSFPNSRISFLVDSRWNSLVELNQDLSDVIVLPRKINLSSILSIRKNIYNQFDLVLDLQRILKSGVLSFLTRAKRRIGFNKKNSKEFNYFFNNEQIQEYTEDLSKIHHYHKFLDYLNIKTEEDYQFGICDGINKLNLDPKYSVIFTDTYISLCLGSSWKTKDWDIKNYQELISFIKENTTYKIILLGGKDQIENSNLLCSKDKSRILNIVGKTTLVELAKVISYSKVLISPDSGPAHLAAALNVQCITLFGPTNPARVAPYKMDSLVVKSNANCSPCNKKICPLKLQICMEQISAKEVYRKLQEVL